MRTCAEVSAWCASAAEQFGDPSIPVCQLFFRWQDHPKVPRGDDELVCGMLVDLMLFLGPDFPALPLPVSVGEMRLYDGGGLMAFGADCVAPGVWGLTPSLNVQGVIHAFVVIYGVPDPAPFERRIILPGGA